MICALCGKDGAETKPTLEAVIAAWEEQAPRVRPLCPDIDAKGCTDRTLALSPFRIRAKLSPPR